MIKRIQKSAALFAATCMFMCTNVFAGEDPATDALWEVNLAGFGRYGASYPGSEDSQFNFIPLPFPVYRGKIIRIGEDTDAPFRGRIFRTDRIKLDIDLHLNFGADSKDIDAREGMPDLDLLTEIGPELDLQFVDQGWFKTDAFLDLQLRGALSWDGADPAWRGGVFSTEFKFVRNLSKPRQQIKLRVAPTFASSDYMDYYYTVQPQFATADRPAYDADGGYLGTEIVLSMRQPITDRLEVWGGIREGFYSGAKNEDSPLLTAKTNTAIYCAFLYRFWESDQRATD